MPNVYRSTLDDFTDEDQIKQIGWMFWEGVKMSMEQAIAMESERATTVQRRMNLATNRSAAWQWIDTANRLVVDAEQKPRNFGPAFHTQDDILNAPPIEYAIDGFLQKDAITLIGGPPAAMKTYSALHIAKALLDGEGAFLFDQFRVAENAKRVIYLTPEASLTTFVARLRKLNMLDYALGRNPRFRFNTISAEEPIHDLRDERLLPYIAGADIILDTVVRFGEGDENSAQDTRRFSEALLWMISQSARTVIGIHHSPKGSGRELTLDNTLRGSGDYGAVAATVWRLEKIDELKSQIYFKCVKDRDFSQAPNHSSSKRARISTSKANSR